MRTYLFYDLETSGLNKSFDQILQFAAVRTDANFNEIERHSFFVKLRPDVIPSPLASITHRIKISETLSGISEYEAAKKIHKIFNTPGTVSLGYNTLGFDDEFLRFTFYRNLLTPYTHQYKDNCFRMDLFPLTVMYSLYKKEVLKWPVIDGKISLKLENINNVNDMVKGQAHDAIVDVNATIELARRLMKEKEMWNYLSGFFDKGEDMKRIVAMPEVFQSETGIHRLGILFSASFGADRNFQTPALLIGNSIPYKNQYLWLRLDLPELRNATIDNPEDFSYVIRKKIGEPEFILPPKDRFIKMIDPERTKEMDRNIDFLMKNPEIFKKISHYYRNFRYEEIPDLDVDSSLYQDGFMDDDERMLCENFHKLPPKGKVNAVKSFKTKQNRELAARILFRNFDMKDAYKKEYIESYLKRINPEDTPPLVDFTGKERTTPKKALEDIKMINESADYILDSEQKNLLDELESYIKSNFSI